MTEADNSPRAGYRLCPDGPGAVALLLGALAIGCAWRLPAVEQAFLFGDELHTLFDLSLGHAHLLSHFSATGSGLALPILQRLLTDVFGVNHWAIRAPAWVAGIAILPATWLIVRRWLGDRVALGATWLVAVSPLLVFYSHFARSYALVALLVVVLVDRVQAALHDGQLNGRQLAWLTALVALAPWAHPTALGSVVPIVGAGVLSALLQHDRDAVARRRLALGLAFALGAGGVLCAALHAPAYASMIAFVSTKTTQTYSGSFGPLDLAVLATGGQIAAVALGLLGLVGAIALLRRGRSLALPVLAAGFAPLVVIVIVRPYGDAYAYARYVIAALPPMLVMAAYGLDRALFAVSVRLAERSAWVAAAIALTVLMGGPPGPLRDPSLQHANTYLGLHALPAFDAAWPDTPAFYRTLADARARGESEPTLVEIPALTTRTRHLYRHYQRQHGARTLLGPLPGEFPMMPAGPYVPFWMPLRLEASDADYLIVHRNVSDELARYWAWVYGADHAADRTGDEAFMARHAQYGGLLPAANDRLLTSLEKRFGTPVFDDGTIVVHRIEAQH